MFRLNPNEPINPRGDLLLFALVYLPFFINDIALRFAANATQWILIDYAFRFVVLGLVVAIPGLWRLAAGGNEPTIALWKLILATVAVGVAAIIADIFLIREFPDPIITATSSPLRDYQQSSLLIFDLTAGLFMVALSEEIVARRIAARVIGRFTSSRPLVVVTSALLFGMVHWGMGWLTVTLATLAGVLLMILYLSTLRLWPIVAVHYVVDLLAFSGLMREFALGGPV